MLGRHNSIIFRLLKKYRETGKLNETKIGGRPGIYKEREDCCFLKACKNLRTLSIKSIEKTLDAEYGDRMSFGTILCPLNDHGMKRRVLKKALLIRKPYVVKRKK